MATPREPEYVQAWLIGSGIASLATAVHLINHAKVPADQIHIVDTHQGAGGAMKTDGNAEEGYILHTVSLPYFHEGCMENLLEMVPNVQYPSHTLLEVAKEYEVYGRPKDKAATRIIRRSKNGPEAKTTQFHIGAHHRTTLITFILEHERTFDYKKISDIFEHSFFETDFWTLWSTTFMLQPWHSAIEFRRFLIKYLHQIHTINDLRVIGRTKYTLFESVILPITQYLQSMGVDFRFDTTVIDLEFNSGSDPATVSGITMVTKGKKCLVTITPQDVVVVTLGSISASLQSGSNQDPPAPPRQSVGCLKDDDWSLWFNLANKSPKFGNPSAFCTCTDESRIETFTTTINGTDFMHRYWRLTKDKPGTGALLTLADSPWGISISVPRQPLFATQPGNVQVLWGFGLRPERQGQFTKKPMDQCNGEEIFIEVLSHLGFPLEPILFFSVTIPSIIPLGTSALLARSRLDRPNVIPPNMTNVAFIGQYSEIAEDTTCSIEYSVRGAEMAVSQLMGLRRKPPKVKKNILLEVFELLI